MSDPQGPDMKALDAAIQSAVDALVSDLVASADPDALQSLALSGPADAFAAKWQDVPSYRDLALLLPHDSRIRALLKPSNADAPVLYSYMIGTPMWVMKAPAGLLAASCFDLLAADESMTQQSLATALLANIKRLRRIGSGQDVDCAFVVGLDGFAMPDGAKLATRLGVIRQSGVLGDAMAFFGGRAANVLSGRFAMRIRIVEPGEVPAERLALDNVERAARSVLMARLAIILADSGVGEPLKPVPALHIVTAPYLGFMGGMTLPRLNSPLVTRQSPLTNTELAAVQTWIEVLSTRPIDNVSIALERIVTASTERIRKEDILIDSVMAWENLLGTDSETTFRVTASLSHLLEANAATRRERHKELKKLYKVRSRVVHGESPSALVVGESATRALDVAKQAMSVIFAQEPWLLDLTSSSERADAILMGYPPGMYSSEISDKPL
jgi:Apea-like HEPN